MIASKRDCVVAPPTRRRFARRRGRGGASRARSRSGRTRASSAHRLKFDSTPSPAASPSRPAAPIARRGVVRERSQFTCGSTVVGLIWDTSLEVFGSKEAVRSISMAPLLRGHNPAAWDSAGRTAAVHGKQVRSDEFAVRRAWHIVELARFVAHESERSRRDAPRVCGRVPPPPCLRSPIP